VSRAFDRAEIKEILPHRHPFLFVDEVLEIVPRERIVGAFQISESGAYLLRDGAGELHFPPTLLAEAMAQVGAILVLHEPPNRGRTIYFRAIDQARFLLRIPPGATVRVEGVVKRMRGRLGSLSMKAFLDGELAAEGVMGFALSAPSD
jgi:3-hydroxyacyl-[acyl-carrier-protein] dehydratase